MQRQDDADKIQGLMHIYKTHVKQQSEEVFTKKQKDPEMIDELDKHLKYMEKLIRQLQESGAKNTKKAKDHITSRTEENKNLIVALSELRVKDKKRAEDQQKVDKKITEIQLAKRRIDTEIEKMREEMQKMKLLDGQKPGATKTSSFYTRKQDGDAQVQDNFKRTQSRGKLIKGSQWRNRPAGMYKNKIGELMGSLGEASEMIMMQ